jgi:hypothetical protein
MRKKVSALDLVVCTLLLSFVLIYIRTLTLTLPDLQFGNSVQFSVRVQLLKKKRQEPRAPFGANRGSENAKWVNDNKA